MKFERIISLTFMVAFVQSTNENGHHTREIWLEQKLQEDIFFGYNTDVRPLDMGNIIQWNLTYVINNFGLKKNNTKLAVLSITFSIKIYRLNIKYNPV